MLRNLLYGPIFVLFMFAAGCTGLPVSRTLPAGITSEPVVTAAVEPFAPDPTGQNLAFSRKGLNIITLDTKKEIQVTTEKPTALAWSPDGSRLAAAFISGSETSMVKLYGTDGTKLGNTEVVGTIGNLAWRSADELLIAEVLLTNYKFGSACMPFRFSEKTITCSGFFWLATPELNWRA